MNSRPGVSAVLLSLAAVSVGCSDTQDGYVKFEETAPSANDLKQTLEPPRGQIEPLQANPTPVMTANAVDLSNSQRADHVVSKTDAGTAAVAISKLLPENVEASELPDTESQQSKPVETVVSAQSGLSGPADVPVVENAASSEPRKIELLIPEKHFRKERGTSALRVNYDDIDLLKVLNMEPVPLDAPDHFPEWLRSLNGKPIRIRGFMYPTFEATGLTGFTLARDNGICCFVRQPKIYDIIAVTLADGVTTDYIEGRPFDVEGVFRVDPKADERDLARLYRIENATVVH